MTVSDVDGNFLQLGNDASEHEDARSVMLVDSLLLCIFFLSVRSSYIFTQGNEALHGAGLLVWLVLLCAEQ